MNRKDKINKLMSEGFSSDTLINFTDKNIDQLYTRFINEDENKQVKLSSETPNIKNVVDKLKNQGVDDIEITETEKNLDVKKKNRTLAKQKKEIKEMINGLVESRYTEFTSKSSIMEMISSKLKEKKETDINEKKIPEFMTYDSITSNSPAPTIAPTKPKTTPGIKPRTPYNPGPGKNPKPKAMGEDKKVK